MLLNKNRGNCYSVGACGKKIYTEGKSLIDL